MCVNPGKGLITISTRIYKNPYTISYYICGELIRILPQLLLPQNILVVSIKFVILFMKKPA